MRRDALHDTVDHVADGAASAQAVTSLHLAPAGDGDEAGGFRLLAGLQNGSCQLFASA